MSMLRQICWNVLPWPVCIVLAPAGLSGNCFHVTFPFKTAKWQSIANMGVHVLSISEL